MTRHPLEPTDVTVGAKETDVRGNVYHTVTQNGTSLGHVWKAANGWYGVTPYKSRSRRLDSRKTAIEWLEWASQIGSQ